MNNGSDIRKIVGNALRDLRIQKELTQEKLAECLGVQTHTINRIENGKSFISSELLQDLCNYFNVAPAVFFMPRVELLHDCRKEYQKEIEKILPTFNAEKLMEIYNILLVLKK